MFKAFNFVPQHDQMDCGPACLAMITQQMGKKYPLSYLRAHSYLTREGVSLSGMVQACEKIGLEAISVKITLQKLISEKPLPCILFWNNGMRSGNAY